MSARIIVILIGVALVVVSFLVLPRGSIATVLLIMGGIALLLSLAEAGRQLFNDLRWLAHRISTKHLPPPR